MPRATSRLTWHSVLSAWRGITRAELRTTFVLGCGLWVYQFFALSFEWTLGDAVFSFTTAQVKAFALLPAFVVADRLTGTDPDRRGVYALAVIAGAAVGAIVAVTLANFVLAPLFWGRQGISFRIGVVVYFFLDLVLLGWATVWVILDRRRARRSQARLHRAELERIAAQRRSVESDLQAMQARVEPQFLFSTLAQVKDLYGRDPTLGERMLDELIAYLRAAMPKMRETSSTVGQELELVRAYLAIVKVRLGERLRYEIEPSPGAGAMRMPPMMLLPLVDHAISDRQRDAGRRVAVHIRADRAGSRVRLRIAFDSMSVGLEGEGIAGIRERLAALYGADGVVVLHRKDTHASEAVLEIPCEPVSIRVDPKASTSDYPPLGALGPRDRSPGR